jgi:hypothetical protein
MTKSGYIEYPNEMNERIQKFEANLEQAYFQDLDIEAKEEVLAEIRVAYRLYYMAKTHKPDALSQAIRDCDRMANSAKNMLKSINSINDPIAPHYDFWMHRNKSAGTLKTALKNHVKALYWAERQLDTVSKPEQQLEVGARNQFKHSLKAIYERHYPPSETADFDDNLGAFIAATLEAFDF